MKNLGEIEGVVVFHPDIYFTSIGQSMGSIAKSFKGDGEGITCYLCAKLGLYRRVVAFHLDIYLASIGQSMGCIAKSLKADGEEIMCYLCAKFGRNQRGPRFFI